MLASCPPNPRMYYVAVRTLPQSVLDYIRREGLLRPGDRLGMAVSGGADSVALLRIMLELREELGIVLSVVHFNHKLRGVETEEDEGFVAQLSRRHELPLHAGAGDVRCIRPANTSVSRLPPGSFAINIFGNYLQRIL